ncbi:MAG: MipA/OmpV family protein [Gammaproteobacteria bacterium]|nr:MipA/OmpV family protein [Gammaproteobacteria bacterium]
MSFRIFCWILGAVVSLVAGDAWADLPNEIAGGVQFETSEYRNGDDRVNPFLSIDYGRWFLHGADLGARIWREDAQSLAFGIAWVDAGFDSADPGFEGMRTLNSRTYLNVLWHYRGDRGGWEMHAEAGADVSGNSDGIKADAGVGYGWRLGDIVLTPHAGGTWLDKRETRYRYAVYANEATAARTAYEPSAAFSPYFGLNALWLFTERQGLRASFEARQLDDTIRASPLVDTRWQHKLALMYGYSF